MKKEIKDILAKSKALQPQLDELQAIMDSLGELIQTLTAKTDILGYQDSLTEKQQDRLDTLEIQINELDEIKDKFEEIMDSMGDLEELTERLEALVE